MNSRKISDYIDLNRRGFLKLSAGAAAGLAVASLPEISFAKDVQIKRVKLSACPSDPIKAADSSELVKNAYQSIIKDVKSIKDSSLRVATLAIVETPAPTFMKMYQNKTAVDSIYTQLSKANYINKEKMSSADKLFPPCTNYGKAPQPFWSAPGSGYQSHHSYPGGLVIHTATNLGIADAVCSVYNNTLNYNIDRDVVIASEALHDLAKPWVFQWNADSSSLVELPLAGTGSHHIFSIAEGIYRKLPSEVVVALACAHSHPGTAKEEESVVNWIKCAAILAGVDPISAGLLNKEGNGLPAPHKQEGYITHLADHDYVLSVPAAQKSIALMKEVAKNKYAVNVSDADQTNFNKFRNYASAQLSMMRINYASTVGDPEKSVTALLGNVFSI